MKTKVHAIMVAAVVAAALAANADTVVWYTFDDLGDVGTTLADSSTIQNKAKPGTLDATMYGMYGKTKTPTTASAWMPYVTNGVPKSVRVLDPVGGTMASAADKALHFKRTHGAGSGAMLEIPNDPALRPSSFTVEMFVRVDPTQSNWEMIASQPHSTTTNLFGWGINFYMPTNNAYLNFQLNFVDTAGVNHQHGVSGSTLLGNKWHHIALAVTPQSGDPSKINIKFFIDYVRVYNYDAPYGIVLPDSADCPVQIGGTTMEGQLFAGDIGEFRFSDKALDLGEFLRPHNAEIDKDVVLYYDFEDYPEDWSWFAAGSGDVVNKANPGVMGGTFVTQNAFTPEVVEDTPAERIRQSMTDCSYETSENALSNSVAHAQSGYLKCTPTEDWFSKTNFTIELFYKMDGNVVQYTPLFRRWGGGNVQMNLGVSDINNSIGITTCTENAPSTQIKLYDRVGGNYNYTNDGKWHHAAVVVDQTGESKTVKLYRDHVKRAETTLDSTLASQFKTSIDWYIAGANSSKSFNGRVDSVRVTLRALVPEEFLTSRRYPEGRTIAHLKFDDGSANAADGGGALFNGVINSATFSDNVPGYKITDGEGGTVLSKPDVASLSIPSKDASVTWSDWFDQYYLRKDTNGVERASGTVELWVKGSVKKTFAAILDAKMTANGTYNDNLHAWRLGYDGSEGGKPYVLFRYLKTDGTRDNQRLTFDKEVTDGKWHHWAFTFQPNASDSTKSDIAFYLDHDQLGTVQTLPGRVAYDDTLRFTIGEAGSSFTGLIDELRISDCVLTPAQFLRAEKEPGLTIIFR